MNRDDRILRHRDDPGAFRQAVRAWIDEVLAPGWQDRLDAKIRPDFHRLSLWWMEQRNRVGLATPHWPVEYGGAGLGLRHLAVVCEEMTRARAPSMRIFDVSLNHIPATLIPWGTPQQRERYLPGIAQGTVWCQGFSEPGSGSDLASLRCRAVRDGGHYVVNGQKIWSSYSMYARHCILLVRTDPDAAKHRGITFLILDMDTPGVEVRPIRQANGSADFGELFLTDVRIPVENRVGGENEGWTVTQSTLAAERGVYAFEVAERLRWAFDHLLREAVDTGAAWFADAQYRREFMTMFGEMQALRRMIRGLLAEPENGPPTMTPAFVKLTGTSLRQRFAAFLVRLRGLDGQCSPVPQEMDPVSPMYEYVTSFGETIAAGSNEIMRNLIAERGLGLPKG